MLRTLRTLRTCTAPASSRRHWTRTLTTKSSSATSSKMLVQRATLGHSRLPEIQNEPFLHYRPGTAEREQLKEALISLRAQDPPEIPCIVGGERVFTGHVEEQVMPSDHKHVLARYHVAGKKEAKMAVDAALAAKADWEALPFEDRAAIFLKAADLLSVPFRAKLNAATMLGAGKTVWQAEIDAAVETIDFWRFGPKFVEQLYDTQPLANSDFVWNRMEYRPLEGFVYAVSPFNFTAIAANLPSSPAFVGNTVVWKPASTNLLSASILYDIMEEAGLPPGVINMLPGHGAEVSDVVLKHRDLAGVHFTGSTNVFRSFLQEVTHNIRTYRSYPRVVGETGGKNFHMVHESADLTNVIHNTVRSAFEFQGQKCSACSRLYAPNTVWGDIKQGLVRETKAIMAATGQPDEFSTFYTAVIDERAFDRIVGYIERAKASEDCEILVGGGYDKSQGYFIEPTIIQTKDPHFVTMEEEIFGPVLTAYVYDAEDYEETLQLVDQTSPYALTGAIFAKDRYATEMATNALRHSAGNFYINDKSTGSVVGQQPFGGARASGTNDKSGSAGHFMRWVSARSIKEGLLPVRDWKYPYMQPEKSSS